MTLIVAPWSQLPTHGKLIRHQICKIERLVFPPDLAYTSQTEFRNQLRLNNAIAVALESSGLVAGYAAMEFYQYKRLVSHAGVNFRARVMRDVSIATHPDHRGKGVATMCLQAMIDRATQAGYNAAIFHTFNDEMGRVFNRLGAVLSDSEESWYSKGKPVQQWQFSIDPKFPMVRLTR